MEAIETHQIDSLIIFVMHSSPVYGFGFPKIWFSHERCPSISEEWSWYLYVRKGRCRCRWWPLIEDHMFSHLSSPMLSIASPDRSWRLDRSLIQSRSRWILTNVGSITEKDGQLLIYDHLHLQTFLHETSIDWWCCKMMIIIDRMFLTEDTIWRFPQTFRQSKCL